jgi:hypothetical protein
MPLIPIVRGPDWRARTRWGDAVFWTAASIQSAAAAIVVHPGLKPRAWTYGHDPAGTSETSAVGRYT